MNYISYFPILSLGIVMVAGTLLKLLGGANIDSDWFWFLTGCGLVVQGTITFIRQREFQEEYKVLKRKSKNGRT